MFCFTVRIGELKALKWSDINDNYIHIYKQIDSQGDECDVKKKSKAGHRKLPISEFAWSILNILPKDGEYILMKDNKVLNTDSFNARLKKDVMNVESDIYLHTKSDFLTVLCF